MPVYVDNFYVTGMTYRGMKMSHMIADTTEELLDMVDKIGVQRKWIQHRDTPEEHFDIAASKRSLAIENGARPVNFRQYARMISERQKTGKLNHGLVLIWFRKRYGKGR